MSKMIKFFLDALAAAYEGYRALLGKEVAPHFRDMAKVHIIECLGTKLTPLGTVNIHSQDIVDRYQKLLSKTHEVNALSMVKKNVDQVVQEWLLIEMDGSLE